MDYDTTKSLTGLDQDEMMFVYDADRGYTESADTLEKTTWFFRPTRNCPMGYYYVEVGGQILEQGDIPSWKFFLSFMNIQEEVPSSPRGRSYIADIKHEQVEINRATSKRVEHSTALGDDKFIVFGRRKDN